MVKFNSMNNILLTVFTPTFNRAAYLNRCYAALLNQTYKHFEWIIIDDGSTDNTRSVVDEFIKENKIKINYYYQENAGKHNAFNKAVQLANGGFFLVLDSDDACKENAFEILVDNWNKIPDNKKAEFVGVTGLCEDQNGELVGDRYPYSPFDSTPMGTHYKYKIKGEKWGILRTDILKQFKYPEKKASFYPDSYLWFKIGKQYKTRYINEIVRIYYIEAKHSITKPSAITKENASVKSDYYLVLINDFAKYTINSPTAFIKHFILYFFYSRYSDRKFTEIIKPIRNPLFKLIGTILYPVSNYYSRSY